MKKSSDKSIPHKVPSLVRSRNYAIPRTREHGLTAVGAAFAHITRPLFKRHGFNEAALLTQWPTIVGHELAARCLPKKLSFHRGTHHNGTLTLTVSGGGFAVEIQHRTFFLIERINTYFGYAVVEHIKIYQGPLPRPPCHIPTPVPMVLSPEKEKTLMTTLTSVRDDSLRAALACLGHAVLSRLDPSCSERTNEHNSAVTSGSIPNQAANPGRA